MKKLFYLFAAIMLIPFLSIAGELVESPVGQTVKKTATQVTKSTTATTAPVFYITSTQMGPVKLGAVYTTLPKSVTGLYDKYVVGPVEENDMDGYSFRTITFYKNGKEVLSGEVDPSNKKFNSLSTQSSILKIKIAGHVVLFGSRLSDMKKLSGVKRIDDPMYDDKYNDIVFYTDDYGKINQVMIGY